ncbi:S1/P1 nuclease [Uliginosibacterium sp. 31-12]|uniref:S1/P1 nuclease n=1 Tax=Uliginosibacterium sp. 31-12 TaxID=3062781 RepID=UPI0026E468E5|nr:S1/P1 nuclease [Uliginosibacterium sp. 31-12]MDO6385912.1 S1/P1 nuclease [Uliginosibacterium sp. 31-12]
MLSRLLLVAALLCISGGARAWNAQGHAAVAAIAEAQLSPAALRQVSALLVGDLDRKEKSSGRKHLSEIASWPDEIRDEAVKTDPAAYKGWHVRSNQICSEQLGACRDGNCVDQLIIRYAAVLADRSQPQRARNEALKWVVHLLGDLHMPLHSGVNRNGGGAKVLVTGMSLKPDDTFHTVWDGVLLNAALAGWTRKSQPVSRERLAVDSPTQWMIETRDLARREVYEPLPGFSCDAKLREPIVLDLAYQQHSVAVIRAQIERAGLRLAQLLNQLLAD